MFVVVIAIPDNPQDLHFKCWSFSTLLGLRSVFIVLSTITSPPQTGHLCVTRMCTSLWSKVNHLHVLCVALHKGNIGTPDFVGLFRQSSYKGMQ